MTKVSQLMETLNTSTVQSATGEYIMCHQKWVCGGWETQKQKEISDDDCEMAECDMHRRQ